MSINDLTHPLGWVGGRSTYFTMYFSRIAIVGNIKILIAQFELTVTLTGGSTLIIIPNSLKPTSASATNFAIMGTNFNDTITVKDSGECYCVADTPAGVYTIFGIYV